MNDTDFDLELDRDLEDYLGAQVPVGATEDGTVVLPAPDEEFADKLLYRARRLREEAARIRQHAQRRIDEMRAWEADRTAGITADQARVRRSLEGFARAFIPRTKRKSLPLANGTLKLTAPGAGRIEIDDERAVVAWCEENGRADLLRYRPEPAKAAIGAIEQRHAAPARVVENEYGEPEEWETWHIMATIGEGEERELVTIPGVVYMRRKGDRFAMTLTGEEERADSAGNGHTSGEHEDNQESEA